MWVRCRSWLVLEVVELAILMQDWWATYLWKIMHIARCATWSVISHYDTTLFRLAYTVVLFVLFLLPIDGRALHCIYWWWCGHCGGSHRPIIQFRAHPGEAPRVQDGHPCKWPEMQLYVSRVVCARIVSCRMQIYCVYVYIDEDHGTGQGSVLHPALPGSSPDIGEAMVPAVCPTSVQYMYIYCPRSHMCPKLYLLFLCFSAIMFRKHFAAKQRLKKRRVAVFVIRTQCNTNELWPLTISEYTSSSLWIARQWELEIRIDSVQSQSSSCLSWLLYLLLAIGNRE